MDDLDEWRGITITNGCPGGGSELFANLSPRAVADLLSDQYEGSKLNVLTVQSRGENLGTDRECTPRGKGNSEYKGAKFMGQLWCLSPRNTIGIIANANHVADWS